MNACWQAVCSALPSRCATTGSIMAKAKPAVVFADGPAPEHASFVPRRASRVSRQPQAILQKALQSNKKELWLLQLPADVSVDALRGVHLYLPTAGAAAPASSTYLQGTDYQLLDETPQPGSASSQVVTVVLGQQQDNSQQHIELVAPVKRRVVLARRCTPVLPDAQPPLQQQEQGTQAPANEARPNKKAKLTATAKEEDDGLQGTGTMSGIAAPSTPAGGATTKDEDRKAKKAKKEKSEKKEKSSRKEKKRKARDSDSEGGGGSD